MPFREEVINVQLAHILRKYGLKANPEVIERESRKLPDVLVIIGGLRLVIEGRTTTDIATLNNDARDRLNQGIADISMSLVYEEHIRESNDLDELKESLLISKYKGSIFYWSVDGISDTPFENSTIEDLVSSINNIFGVYVKNNILNSKVEEINSVFKELSDKFANTTLFFNKPKIEKDLKKALGIGDE